MLERVQRRRPVGGVVDRRDVPEVEVDRPQREGDERVGEDLEPVEGADREERLQQRAGQPEDDQQRGDVADQQVLDHVGEHQLVGDVADRAEERDRDRQQAGAEAELAPERHAPARPGESQHPVPVEDAGEGDRHDLDRHERAGDVGERQLHEIQTSAGFRRQRRPAPVVAWPRLERWRLPLPADRQLRLPLRLPHQRARLLRRRRRVALPAALRLAQRLRRAARPRRRPLPDGALRRRRADQPPLPAGDAGDRDHLGDPDRLGGRPRRADDRRVGRAGGPGLAPPHRARVRPLPAAHGDLRRRPRRAGDGVPAALRLRRRGGRVERRRAGRSGRARRRRHRRCG